MEAMAIAFSRPAGIVPILRRADGSYVTFTRKSFRELEYNENTLQELIASKPELLGLPELLAKGRQVIALREVTLPTMTTTKDGRLDILLLTSMGDVIAVEVKLKDNPELRRHVVAQALDYHLALRQIGQEELDLLARLAPADGSPGRMFRTWNDWVRAAFPTSADPCDLARRFASNLSAGRFPIMIVGDETSRLRDLADELRPHMNFDLLLADICPWASSDGGEVLFVGTPDTEVLVVQRTVITIEGAGETNVNVIVREESAMADTDEATPNPRIAERDTEHEISLLPIAETLGSDPSTLRSELFDCARDSVEPSRAWKWLDDALRWPRPDVPPPGRWHTSNAKAKPTWGRVGVNTSTVKGWYPGVFWGVILDPRDHSVHPLSSSGPDFVIIVSTVKPPNYAGFGWERFNEEEVGKLADSIRPRAGRWVVYEHLKDPNPLGGKWNQYHRLYLRRELAEVWRGATTPEERFRKWMSAAEEGLRILTDGGEIRRLIDSLHSHTGLGE